MILDKDLEIKIGGKEYKLCFTVKRVFETERQLPSGNLVDTLASQPLCVEAVYVLLKEGIRGGGTSLSENDAEKLFLQAMEEHGFNNLSVLLIAAVGKSGVLGNVKNKPAAENQKEA